MADQPVARSAVSLPEKTPSAGATVRLTDRSNSAKLLIHHRGDGPRPVSADFGTVVAAESNNLIVGWAPGQSLIIGDGDPIGLSASASESDQKVDVSHSFTLLSIAGEGAATTLAKLCAIDFSTRTKSVVRTSVAKVATAIVTLDDEFLLMCDRSYGQYLCDEVLVAAAEFGVAPSAP